MPAPTAHPEYDHPLPGWGAFKHADSDDAQRRQPGASLETYARERGLEYLGSEHVPGWAGVLPGDGRLQFNVCRDPGGTLLFHEVFPVAEDPTEGRGPRGVVKYVYAPKQGKRFALSFVPILGSLLTDADKRPEAVGVPATVAAALVPEAACVPEFEVTGEMLTPRATGLPDLPPDFVQRLMSGPFADAVRAHAGRPYFHAAHEHARLVMRVDGYAEAPELDALRAAVAQAAGGLAQAVAPEHRPQPFDQPLPPAPWPQWKSGPDNPGDTYETTWTAWHRPQPPWLGPLREQLKDGAAEDALAFHRAFPRLPIPGRAFVVIRRDFQGVTGRIAFYAEQQILAFNVGHNAVLLPAKAGAPDSAPATDGDVSYAVRDGIFCAWAPRGGAIVGDVDGLAERARRLAAL